MKNLLLTLVFCVPFSLLAQEGIYSGTLTDENSQPLPGVSIIVVGQNGGVQSDFDGNYNISCSVGDTLHFSYLGMKTRYVMVTKEMLGYKNDMQITLKKPVKKIRSIAYEKALQNKEQHLLKKTTHTYNKNTNYFQHYRVKNIDIQKDNINLTYFKPDIFYEVGFTSKFGAQYIQNRNLPQSQNIYAQGMPFQGNTTYFGPENGTIFSYGPRIGNLEFNGVSSEYNTNGSLVDIGSGNGQAAKNYKNSIYDTAIQNNNHLFFNVSTNTLFLEFDYSNKTNKDVYNKEKITFNKGKLTFNRNNYDKAFNWESYINYATIKNNQPNNNGFYSNVLFGTLATPISFSNLQGATLSNGLQRSFSPLVNNPFRLLNNKNSLNTRVFTTSFQPKMQLSDDSDLRGIFNYTHSKSEELVTHYQNTVGFLDGYSKKRNVSKNNFDARLSYNFQSYIMDDEIRFSSALDFNYEQLDYDFFETIDLNNTNVKLNSNRNTFRWLNTFGFSVWNNGLNVAITNNSYISSLQEDEWLLGGIQLQFDIDRTFDIYGFRDILLTVNASNNVSDSPLLYNNRSHNSLRISPQESFSYTENNDLFVTDDLLLERKSNLEISTLIQPNINNTFLSFHFTYYNTKTKGAVFPIYKTNNFELSNTADVRRHGYEIVLEGDIGNYDQFRYSPSLVFSSYRTKTLNVVGSEPIPIAGFSTISKNLAKNQPAGVLIGSAYERDNRGNKIIDSQGFPIVANVPKIIGDSTPEYNVGFTNTFKLDDFSLQFIIDFQKGGDIWNGTQNVLDYLGRSKKSGTQRTITDYIFKGIDEQGNTNAIPVDFGNPANGLSGNRFVRYGFEGVAEEAIEDGSYVNLKSIELKYDGNYDDSFIRKLSVILYANNLFMSAKFNGRSPYESLYDSASGAGLNFFNIPLTTEVGCKLKIVL